MKETWICEVCGQRVDKAWERVERRIEYRRGINDGRLKTVQVGRLCEQCATTEAEDLRGGRKAIAIEQRETSTQEGFAI